MSKIRNILIMSATGVALASAVFATDYQALRDDARIHSELVSVSQAYLIEESCSSMSIRKLNLVGRALSLRTYAKGLGFSGGEVDQYVNDRTEQARFRVIAGEMLADKGVVEGNAASFCDAGRAEISAGTFTGAILRGG